ncbi:Protein of unknown function [Pyronema omphalodes CBS 100304]|uniref:Uncharacterized protein n=1 Tax=Pyronema omphalodes (strain CBS 100304) TaxID=1076935 RepID=U4LGG6_PYROM|nr:Protein of unknown function [Pyronema omphalodes CBS 100304]
MHISAVLLVLSAFVGIVAADKYEVELFLTEKFRDRHTQKFGEKKQDSGCQTITHELWLMKYSRKRTRSYKVKGACCEFFSDQNCSKNSHTFTAKNRKDGVLALPSQLVQSFKCEHSDCREG